jgi:hypothetical protein
MVENTPSNCTAANDAFEVASFIGSLVYIPLIDTLRLDAFLLDKLTPTEHRMRAARSWPIILPGARLSPEYFAPEDRDVNTQDDVPEQGRMIAVLIASFDDMAMLGYLPVAAAAWKRIVGVEPVVVLCNTTIEGVAHGSAVQLAYWHIVREEALPPLSRRGEYSVALGSMPDQRPATRHNGEAFGGVRVVRRRSGTPALQAVLSRPQLRRCAASRLRDACHKSLGLRRRIAYALRWRVG